MGNTSEPGEPVENIITRENVYHSKEDIEEITNENTARDSVKNNQFNEPSEQVTTVNPQKMVKKTNTKEKTKRENRRERTGKGDVLKKYCQLNVQGLITKSQPQEKVELLREIINEERPMFIALTETWLYGHKEAEVHIEDYTIYRKDRPLRRAIDSRGRHVGGVALYIDSSWLPDSREILGYSNSVVDVLAIYSKRENILIAVIYRQPENVTAEDAFRSTCRDFVEPLRRLGEAIEKYSNTETEIQILGDFNMPKADWDLGTHKEGAKLDERVLVANTQELCDRLLLQQIVTIPTHRQGNTLDLVFTNKPEHIHSQWARDTALSHHYLVTFNSNQLEKLGSLHAKTNKLTGKV